MDLNELLHAHQVAVMKASAAGDRSGRDDHFAKVSEYAERVRQLRELHQMSTTRNGAETPERIIYGTYAGETRPPAVAGPVDSWEDEGGALDPPAIPSPQDPLPAGVTMKTFNRYYVGAYSYEDLGLALAEHARQEALPVAA
ncbi:hypothetical protein [Erythrobacter mangrovi]|uniref:Uncharacterized protein n=1 Tax=Erythrobacter mangrovi TaxID=2739433 RepID=A0A7D4CNC6_9SPHN|nr:hypothetical protein [Erythrobacter mangrovi]QKG71948.1 hypothetical protein HQR01_11565 [Erythrobacter mangrovi]